MRRLSEPTAKHLSLTAKSTPEGLVMKYNSLGNLYLRRGRLDAAAEVSEEGLRIYRHPHLMSRLARLSIQRAQQAQARGDGDEVVRQILRARELLVEAVAVDPRDYKSHALLGQVLFNLARLGS